MSKTFFQNWLFADKAIYIFFLLEVVSSASVNRIYHSCFIWSRRATPHSCTFTINTKWPLNDEKVSINKRLNLHIAILPKFVILVFFDIFFEWHSFFTKNVISMNEISFYLNISFDKYRSLQLSIFKARVFLGFIFIYCMLNDNAAVVKRTTTKRRVILMIMTNLNKSSFVLNQFICFSGCWSHGCVVLCDR